MLKCLKDKSRAIKASIQTDNLNTEQSLKLLEGCYKDQEILILGCGPSIGQINKDKLLNKTENTVVFTIKQAINFVGNLSDIHFYNCNNIHACKYYNGLTVVSSPQSRQYFNNQVVKGLPDIHFNVRANINIAQSIAAQKDNKLFDIDVNHNRLWGPGIILESVLPLAAHCKPAKISLLGIDFADPSFQDNGTKYNHFYGSSFGRNPGVLAFGENKTVIEGMNYYCRQLIAQGIQIEILSDKCYLSQDIDRNTELY